MANIISKRTVFQYLTIMAGIIVYSLGFTIFILPHGIVIGGMAGFSTLVYYATAGVVPVAVTMYGVNIILLMLGYRELGRGFALRTVFGATMMSLVIGATEGYFTSHPPIIDSAPMSVLVGSVLLGFGIGLYYSRGGTAGGTDIVAAIMSHKSDISMGRVMMIVDVSIVACSFFLPFDGDMETRFQVRSQTIIYGWVSIFLYSYLADRYLAAGSQTVQFLILSQQWEVIASRITHETGRGATVWDATGYWTGSHKRIVLVWCRKTDTAAIYRIIGESDDSAYVTTSYVHSVHGNGFDHLRLRRR